MKITIFLLNFLFYFSAVAAEPVTSETEQLNYSLPEGFKVVLQQQDNSRNIVEMIRSSETLENWSRMVTIQTFSDSSDYDPEKYTLEVSRLAKTLCGKVQVEPVATDYQNGFLFSHKVIMCEPNLQTGKPEIINIKAIKGKQSFYVAKVSNRVAMDANEIRYWALYLRDMVIESK